MRVPHPAFVVVCDLPDAVLRDLLAVGEPVERIWAAWALGLRLGGAAAGTLRRAAGVEPDSGARRHLVVALAGFGEHAAVAALAASDPDARVRATACQYLERLAAADSSLWAQVRARFDDVAPVVRETLVLHLAADAPAEIRAAAVACIHDDALEVRQAVVGQLDELIGSGAPLPESVKRQSFTEPSRELSSQLLSVWRDREGSHSLLRGMAIAGREDLAGEALELVARVEPEFPWASVAELADIPSEDLSHRIFTIFKWRLEDAPLGWVLRYLAGPGWHWEWPRVLNQLLPSLAELTELAVEDRVALRGLARRALRQLEPGGNEWDDEQFSSEEAEFWLASCAQLVAESRRLCGVEP